MIKLIRLSSVSKEFFDLLDKNKRQKKAVSISKLVVVSVICFVVVGFYALRVNQASTRGYFLKQENRKYNDLVFQRSIVQLDNLQLERKLYDDVFKSRNSRYEDDSRRITVSVGKPPEPVAPALPEVIPTDIDLSASLPEIADMPDFPVTTVNGEEDIILEPEFQAQPESQWEVQTEPQNEPITILE
jgi:hypothetical protein